MHERMNGAHIVQGCSGEPLTKRGWQVVTAGKAQRCTPASDLVGHDTH